MKSLYTIILLVFSQLVLSQTSIIKGTILDDKTGKTIPGVDVNIVNTKYATSTDFDGNFIIREVPLGTYEVQIATSSYKTKIISEVIVKADEATTLTVSLEESKNVLKEVVITRTRAKVESVKSLLLQQKNSASVSDGISAESIKRTPDKSTADVLKRISGASIQDNKFVIIRGLNDRYNTAILNGGTLPSSEPDRKAFSFDIFPSNMLDNLIITKTATPDLPGEFAGGVIQINTKAVPDKDFQSISIGSGYNTITTFKTQKTYEGSPTDILGFDNGTRDLPKGFVSSDNFPTNNQEKLNLAKSLSYDWSINDSRFKPNTSLQYTLGRHYDIKGKDFGMLFSFTHSISNNYNDTQRLDYDNNPRVLQSNIDDRNYREQILMAGLANFSIKLNANNSISFKNIYSINSTDLVLERTQLTDISQPETIEADMRWFTSNKIYSGQLNGDHYFESPKLKLNWTGFYSNIDRSIPNLRRNVYQIANPKSTNPNDRIPVAQIGISTGSPTNGGQMFFSENKESIQGAKIDLSRKFNLGDDFTNEIKIGAFAQKRERDFFSRQLYFTTGGNHPLFDTDLLRLPNETIFSQSNLGVIEPGVYGFFLHEQTKPNDEYKAGSNLYATYLMFDNKFKGFRLIWGARFENFVQTLNTMETAVKELNLNNRYNDFLPSANLIYAIDKKQNLRLSFSKTLNRPEYRELAPFGFDDYETQLFTQGNTELKVSKIDNYDFRYEIYPGKGQLFSFSYFRKNFIDPIEVSRGENRSVTYENAKSAKNSGFEFEFRTLLSSIFTSDKTTIFDDITLFSNLAIIKSVADVSNFEATANTQKERILQGQSPYIINAGLQYQNSDNGWVFSANLNRAGDRLFIGQGAQLNADPELWEKARTFIDMQLAKTFLNKKFEFKLNIQNVLAQDLIFYENRNDIPYDYRLGVFESFANMVFTGSSENKKSYNPDVDDARWITKFGRSFSFTLSYNF
jgi:TonB-dependent receptor